MSFLSPLWLVAGVVAALGVVAIHLIARRRPPEQPFPTTRFVPRRAARATSIASRPTDRWLMALRALAVLLAALALAGPVRGPDRDTIARVVLLDQSRAMGDAGEAAQRARALLRPGDALVTFDTVPATRHWSEGDSIAPTVSGAPGDLAAALIAGIRAARELRAGVDSVELHLVSPLVVESWSEAVLPVRAAWPGRVALHRAAARVDSSGSGAGVRASGPDDPLAATAALARLDTLPVRVRIIRDTLRSADSALARDSGLAVVWWPRDSSGTTTAPGGVVAPGAVAVAGWGRRAIAPGHAVAWWADGSPAATEAPLGAGCVRDVGVHVPETGDAALAPATQALLRALAAPCGGWGDGAPVADSLIVELRGGVPRPARLAGLAATASPATPWLLGAAIALLLGELIARRRGHG